VKEMPKLTTKEVIRKYRAFNELRRNLKNMTPEDIERYVQGEDLVKILGEKYNAGLR